MRRFIVPLACLATLAIPAAASAKAPHPLPQGFEILRPGQITGLARTGCVGGFVARTVPFRRDGFYRWENVPGRGASYVALQDTNGDGYRQGITIDGFPQDGFALYWTQANNDELIVRNNGAFGKIAVKIWQRC